ncbi:MAG TPA: hypothetical protein VNW95_16150 [Mucilaginibacter sp.]|jgi:hypothetical protein|nr:hypothetical protein [Mucilaginibacter sp.]
MKKRSILFAFIIAAFVSVTSGCYVGYGYEQPYRERHYRHYDRYEDSHDDHDNGYHRNHRGD